MTQLQPQTIEPPSLTGGPADVARGALLALDLGTTTGWALRPSDGLIASGTVSFRPSRYDGGGMRYLRFTNWLTELDQLGGPIAELAIAVERVVLELLEDRYPDRRLRTNVEFYAGVVLHQIGLPAELFTPTFAVSRTIGWTAHILEQTHGNRIIRPSSRYVGPAPTVR